jgi:hypothetical protein
MAGRSVKSKATRFRVPCELRYASKMDINQMLSDLRMEREQISEAIMVMERLSLGQGKRRGRPPKWMTEVKRRGRPKGTKNKPEDD